MTPRRGLAIGLLVAALVVVGCGSDDSGSGDEASTSNGRTTFCTLTVKAVAVIADTFKRGGDIAEALGALEPAIVKVCESKISDLFDRPDNPVSFSLQTPGGPLSEATSLRQLAAPPTTASSSRSIPPERLERIFDCVMAYESQFLVDLCVDGAIPPTSP